MKTISFIALYDEFCLDARYASSMLRGDGHRTYMTFFKGIEYTSPAQSENDENGGFFGLDTCATSREVDLLVNTLIQQKPDLIAVFFASNAFGLARFLTGKIKERFTTPVLWAGADSTFSPAENIKYADFLCAGEPEYTMRHLVTAMERQENHRNLPGLWINEEGAITQNPMLHLEDQIDRFPFADFEMDHKCVIAGDTIYDSPFPPQSHLRTNVILRATRPCPFTCPYCQTAHDHLDHDSDGRVRIRSVDNIIQEIKYRMSIWPSRIERIEFHDEFFPLDAEWVAEFSKRYATEVSLPFIGFTRPGKTDPQVFRTLREARMEALIMRIPSGSETVRNQYFHRQESNSAIIEEAKRIMDSGIKLLLEFFHSNPLETEEERRETLAFLCDFPKGAVVAKNVPFSFYLQCALYHTAEQKGLLDQIEQPAGSHTFHAKKTTEMIFWECLYVLAHFRGMEKETVLHFADDEYMREKPGLLQEMVENLYKGIYLDGNPLIDKEAYIHDLRWRLTQAQMQSGAAPVRHAKKLLGFMRS